MKNKIFYYTGIIAILLMLTLPSIFAIEETSLSTEVYESGWFILTSSNIVGIEETFHLGGMHDLNFSTYGENTFIIRTKPIWGSTIIADYVDLHIEMKNFFGIIDVYGNEGVILGICEDISWEEI